MDDTWQYMPMHPIEPTICPSIAEIEKLQAARSVGRAVVFGLFGVSVLSIVFGIEAWLI